MNMNSNSFRYVDCRFADIQMLRYRLKDFDKLSVRQKLYIYYLSEAATAGRDIIFDQNGRYNLAIRRLIEAVYTDYKGNDDDDFRHLREYLYRIWFSNGIYHHYSADKIVPKFSKNFFIKQVEATLAKRHLTLQMLTHSDYDLPTITNVMFRTDLLPKRINQSKDQDLVTTSACNFYRNVTQSEVETYYNNLKQANPESKISWGLNTTLAKHQGQIVEEKWCANGKYGEEIQQIIHYLTLARDVAENQQQQNVIDLLIKYYKSGNLNDFDDYSIEWVKAGEGMIDFINGFIEVYGDPLGMKGTWEGLVHYIDKEATERTDKISQWAAWFEQHSPIEERFKRSEVRGVSARVVCAAMLGGEEYPASAIGINLPNANWIRATYGSKSVTIGNLTEAYDEAAKGNGFRQEFIDDKEMLSLIDKYSHIADDLHTDLHECLGHGSGKLLPHTNPDALKAYGNTIEEARADLFALYYIADEKMVELGLLPNSEAYRANYFTYMLNGLLTQTVRIEPGKQIEEAHMRNRALIAWWVIEHANGSVRLEKIDGKTYLHIDDYTLLRRLFAELLCEIQRIKSEGDYEAAKHLVEKYGVNIRCELHEEVLERYKKLNIAPYRGFINPRFVLKQNENGKIIDVEVDYSESYEAQMLKYSTR